MLKKFKIRTVIGLILLYVATFLNWQWAWGILFIAWALPDVFTGVTYFIEPIAKKENPFLFWAIIGLWLFSGSYLLVDSLAPQVLPNGWSSTYYQGYTTKENGDYILNEEDITSDTLFYKNFVSDEFEVVGFSTLIHYNDLEASSTSLAELWEYFYKQEPSSFISGIIDDKVYVVYSEYDKPKAGQCLVTLGYKTNNSRNLYKGLTAVKVKASKYAVFEAEDNIEEKMAENWVKLSLSELKRTKLNDIEVYQFDSDYQTLEKADLLISVPTSSQDLESLKKKGNRAKQEQGKSVTLLLDSSEDYRLEVKENDSVHKVSRQRQTMLDSPRKRHSSFQVVGLQTTTNYTQAKAMKTSIEELWNQFTKKNYARFISNIKEPNKVYVTYTDYTEELVTVTIGYRTTAPTDFKSGKGLSAVSIPHNEYYHFTFEGNKEIDYQGKEWKVLFEALAYRDPKSSDFEIYTFDNKYKVTETALWVASK